MEILILAELRMVTRGIMRTEQASECTCRAADRLQRFTRTDNERYMSGYMNGYTCYRRVEGETNIVWYHESYKGPALLGTRSALTHGISSCVEVQAKSALLHKPAGTATTAGGMTDDG
jgi:hypothetical protein